MNRTTTEDSKPAFLFVGIDWADSKHDVTVIDARQTHFQIEAGANAIVSLVERLNRMAAGRPIAICIAKARVGIVHHLIVHKNIHLYPVDPKQAVRYRESFSSSGAKDDTRDSMYLARMLAERHGEMTLMKPDDPLTQRISLLAQTRRQLVDDKITVIQKLIGTLKMYRPLLLELPGSKLDSQTKLELMRRFADPRKLKKAHKLTLRNLFSRHRAGNEQQIEELIDKIRTTPLLSGDATLIEPLVIRVETLVAQLQQLAKGIARLDQQIAEAMAKHPDSELFTTLPGAGAVMAPRLLAALGSDRERWKDAQELGSYTGILPVTRQSGKTKLVSRRKACPKYLRQTFHEFADFARKYCDWSRAYYELQRSKGMKHHAAIRKLASRWQRILLSV